MSNRSAVPITVLFLTALLTVGCGPSGDMGYVTGTVTLNGEPLSDATVTFYPTGARASIGRTDSSGAYMLRHTRDADGAAIGEHRVTISTQVVAEVNRGNQGYDGEGVTKQSVITKGRAESMPAKYLDPKKTELTATVSAGSNVINFDLEL